MKDIVPSVVLKERKPRKRTYRKKKPRYSEKLTKTRELVADGFSLKKALELAGYAPSTVKHNANLYLKKLDLDELKRGLKINTALSGFKALKVLDELMVSAEKDSDKIKAGDSVLRAGKTHLVKDETPPSYTFILQTIEGQTVNLNAPTKKTDEIIDITSEKDEEDNS
ncbi:MAG: hypothetical protein ACFFCW_24090 [Candidatus Hodarchaeota archaeon]